MPNKFSHRFKHSGWLICLLSILAFGAFARLQYIHLARNVDEPNIILRAVQVADGKLHIKWYNWPAQSLIRLDGSVFTGIHQIYNITHPSTHYTTQELYKFHSNFFVTTAHGVTTVFSLLAILVIFGIGYVLRGQLGGLLAAGLLSIDYLDVLHSRFATPDVPLTLFLLCNIFIAVCVIKYTPTPQMRRWLWVLAGGVLGAAVATKYTGALAGVPIGLAVVWNIWRSGQKFTLTAQLIRKIALNLGLFLLATWLVHWLLNPFFIVDIQLIIHQIVFESGSHRLGVDWSGKQAFFRNVYYYLHGSLVWNGTFLSIIGWLTMLVSMLKFRRAAWHPILVMTISYFVFVFGLSRLGLHWSRWSLPLTPLILACAAFGLAHIGSFIFSRHNKLFSVLTILLFIMIILPQSVISVLVGPACKSISTSSVMSDYISQHVPTNSRLVADMYYLSGKKPLHVAYPNTNLYKKTFASVKEAGVEYVVVKSKHYSYAKVQPKVYGNIVNFFKALRAHSELIVTVSKKQDTLLNHKKDFGFYQNFPLLFNMFGSQSATHGTTLELYKITD